MEFLNQLKNKYDNKICDSDRNGSKNNSKVLKSVFDASHKSYSDGSLPDKKSTVNSYSAVHTPSDEEDQDVRNDTLLKMIGYPPFTGNATNPRHSQKLKDKRYFTSTKPAKSDTGSGKRPAQKADSRGTSYLSCGPDTLGSIKSQLKDRRLNESFLSLRHSGTTNKDNIFDKDNSNSNKKVPKSKSLLQTRHATMSKSQLTNKRTLNSLENCSKETVSNSFKKRFFPYEKHFADKRFLPNIMRWQNPIIDEKKQEENKSILKNTYPPETELSDRKSQSKLKPNEDLLLEQNVFEVKQTRQYDKLKKSSFPNEIPLKYLRVDDKATADKYATQPLSVQSEFESNNKCKNKKIISKLDNKTNLNEYMSKIRPIDRRCQSEIQSLARQQEEMNVPHSTDVSSFKTDKKTFESSNQINSNDMKIANEIRYLQQMPSSLKYHSRSTPICQIANRLSKEFNSNLQPVRDRKNPQKSENEIVKSIPQTYGKRQNFQSAKYSHSSNRKLQSTVCSNISSYEENERIIVTPRINSLSDCIEKDNGLNQTTNKKSQKMTVRPQKTALNININVKPVCCSHQNVNLLNSNTPNNVQNFMIECDTENKSTNFTPEVSTERKDKIKGIDFERDSNSNSLTNGSQFNFDNYSFKYAISDYLSKDTKDEISFPTLHQDSKVNNINSQSNEQRYYNETAVNNNTPFQQFFGQPPLYPKPGVMKCCCISQQQERITENNAQITNYQEKLYPSPEEHPAPEELNIAKSFPRVQKLSQTILNDQQRQSNHNVANVDPNFINSSYKNERGDTVINVLLDSNQLDGSTPTMNSNNDGNLQPNQSRETYPCGFSIADNLTMNNQNSNSSYEQLKRDESLRQFQPNLNPNSEESITTNQQCQLSNCKLVVSSASKNGNKEGQQQPPEKKSDSSVTGPPRIQIIFSSNITGETKLIDTDDGIIQRSSQQQLRQRQASYQRLISAGSNTRTVKLKDEQSRTTTIINIQTRENGDFGDNKGCANAIRNISNSRQHLNNMSNNCNKCSVTKATRALSSCRCTRNAHSHKNIINNFYERNQQKSSSSLTPNLTQASSKSKMATQEQQKVNQDQPMKSNLQHHSHKQQQQCQQQKEKPNLEQQSTKQPQSQQCPQWQWPNMNNNIPGPPQFATSYKSNYGNAGNKPPPLPPFEFRKTQGLGRNCNGIPFSQSSSNQPQGGFDAQNNCQKQNQQLLSNDCLIL